MNCIIAYILGFSHIHCTGNKQQIMNAITEETGELATEVAIDAGFKDREPGPDGIVGEAIDLIIAGTDMIYADNPDITMEEIQAIVAAKCDKWGKGAEKRRLKWLTKN